MKKRKFNALGVSMIYVLVLVGFGGSLYLVERIMNNHQFEDGRMMEYVDQEIVNKNEYIPVINQEITILKPFMSEQVTISKTFYDYLAESTSQENSIIFYENTYMQNSGVDYTSKENFDIISILDGTVIEVSDNEILGHTIKIKHKNDLVSTYQSLSVVLVKEKDTVLRGQTIGKSGTCPLYSGDANLHFELYHHGKTVNPEAFYNKLQDEI